MCSSSRWVRNPWTKGPKRLNHRRSVSAHHCQPMQARHSVLPPRHSEQCNLQQQRQHCSFFSAIATYLLFGYKCQWALSSMLSHHLGSTKKWNIHLVSNRTSLSKCDVLCLIPQSGRWWKGKTSGKKILQRAQCVYVCDTQGVRHTHTHIVHTYTQWARERAIYHLCVCVCAMEETNGCFAWSDKRERSVDQKEAIHQLIHGRTHTDVGYADCSKEVGQLYCALNLLALWVGCCGVVVMRSALVQVHSQSKQGTV